MYSNLSLPTVTRQGLGPNKSPEEPFLTQLNISSRSIRLINRVVLRHGKQGDIIPKGSGNLSQVQVIYPARMYICKVCVYVYMYICKDFRVNCHKYLFFSATVFIFLS